jgi:nitroreductase
MAEDALYDSLKTVCARRRSVRRFTERPLSEEQIGKIREIARFSPYASGKKNWELLAVTDRALIRELGEVVRSRSSEIGDRVREDFREMFLEYAENFALFESAPVLFIPVFRVQRSLSLMVEAPGEALQRWERDNLVKSISCVAMLVLLAAESLGLGACLMTGPLVAEEELAKRIGVKRGHEIGAIIPVGYEERQAEG